MGPDMKLERHRTMPAGSDPKTIPEEDCGESYWFWCAGCNTCHRFTTKLYKGQHPRGNPMWTFNGNEEKPSFTPSLVYPGWKNTEGKWVGRCHLVLTDGVIKYYSDCHHELADQTVPLEGLP